MRPVEKPGNETWDSLGMRPVEKPGNETWGSLGMRPVVAWE